jgi:S1-C subfamily serine protease
VAAAACLASKTICPKITPMKKFFGSLAVAKVARNLDRAAASGVPSSASPGSGFFVTQDGYVVTNNHVVSNAVEVIVTLEDGRTLDASVVGRESNPPLKT